MPLVKRWVEKPVPQSYACQSTVDSVLNRKLALKKYDSRLRIGVGNNSAQAPNPKRMPKVAPGKK